MPNHKLCKNIYIAKIRSVVQQITISQSDVPALICGGDDDDDDDDDDFSFKCLTETSQCYISL